MSVAVSMNLKWGIVVDEYLVLQLYNSKQKNLPIVFVFLLKNIPWTICSSSKQIHFLTDRLFVLAPITASHRGTDSQLKDPRGSDYHDLYKFFILL